MLEFGQISLGWLFSRVLMNLLSSNDVLYYTWLHVIHWHPGEGATHIPQQCIPAHRPETNVDSENNTFVCLNNVTFVFLPGKSPTKTPYLSIWENLFVIFSKHQTSISKQSDGWIFRWLALSVFVRTSTLNTSLVLLTLALPAACVVLGRSFRSCLVIKSEHRMIDIGGVYRSKLGV